MLNGRIYRAAFLPLLFALVIAGFSLTGRTAPLSSNLAPDAFEGARAFATLETLAKKLPERRPGSAGDRELAAYVAQTLRGLGSPAKGGYAVSTRNVQAPTIEGERTLTTVIAQRPGTTGGAPIVILAHRDAAGRGAEAELSGTAALLEIARVLSAGETQHAIVLVSTSGGSGGNGGAADFAAHASEILGGRFDAALVLGDLAGTRTSGPEVASFSATPASAPALLQSTVAAAVAQQAGGSTGAPGTLAQLVHLAFPLTGGEQGPLGAGALPAVLVGAGSQLPPAAGTPVSATRLEALGRGALAAVYALDGGPEIGGSDVNGSPQTGLPIQQKAIPAWALRLLVAALLLPALAVLGDGLARMRRRRVPVGRWVVWALACALPFLICAVFAMLLGSLGAIPAPRPPVSEAALPFDSHALEAVLASALVLVLAWLAWPALMRRLALPVRPGGPARPGLAARRSSAATLGRPVHPPSAATPRRPVHPPSAATPRRPVHPPNAATPRRPVRPPNAAKLGLPVRARADAAALGMLLVLGGLTVVVWASDPLTALLLLPALNLWLVLAAAPPGWSAGGSGAGGGRLQALALVALGVVPLALLVAFYAHQLHLGLGGVAHTALLLLAGGRIGLVGAVLWSVAFGCLAAALLVALAPSEIGEDEPREPRGWPDDREAIKLRGPLSYAGPGSLGGTESALRR